MFNCNKRETQLVNEGRINGAVRRYPKDMGCPHKPGAEIVLTSRYLRGHEGKEVPFARATIVSVRPGTVGEFRNNDRIAEMDGFDNARSWYTYFSKFMYDGIKDTEPVHHIQMRIIEVDKNL